MADKKKQLDAALSHALMNDMERIEYGFATYWKQIVIAAVAVVIVIAAVFGYFAVSRNAAREAAFALADAATVDELNAAPASGWPSCSPPTRSTTKRCRS